MAADFVGKAALRRIRNVGIRRKQVGLVLEAPPMQGPNTTFWVISHGGQTVGKVTSAVYSPRLKKNIALALVSVDCAALGMALDVSLPNGSVRATVVERPFFDPKKSITTAANPTV
jgi:aminomethyltransferase